MLSCSLCVMTRQRWNTPFKLAISSGVKFVKHKPPDEMLGEAWNNMLEGLEEYNDYHKILFGCDDKFNFTKFQEDKKGAQVIKHENKELTWPEDANKLIVVRSIQPLLASSLWLISRNWTMARLAASIKPKKSHEMGEITHKEVLP